MRATMTFILRLLVDESEPEALRGVLQTVASNEERTFSDASSLLELLRLSQTVWLQKTPEAQKSVADRSKPDSNRASEP